MVRTLRIGVAILVTSIVASVRGILPLEAPIMLDYAALFGSGAWDAGIEPSVYTSPDTMAFDNHVTLNEENDIQLSWNVNKHIITFKLSARTLGWIALGITEEETGSANADFAVMGHSAKYMYIADMHTDANGGFVKDKIQDLTEMYSWETENETFAMFSRQLATCDGEEDVYISEGKLRILWAYGDDDPTGRRSLEDELVKNSSGSMRVELITPMSHANQNDPLAHCFPFDHHVVLGDVGNVKLDWNFNDETITFKISAKTHGWIAFGIGESHHKWDGADFALVWQKQKSAYVIDMHGDEISDFTVDKSQDLLMIHSWQSEEETSVIFSRPLETCDDNEDVDITADTLRIIWAYGSVDPDGELPLKDELVKENSGSLNLRLLNPILPPLSLQGPSTDVRTMELRVPEIKLPLGESRYCRKLGRIKTEKHHIVQFKPLLSQGNEYNVQQIILRECTGTKEDSPLDQDGNCESWYSRCTNVAFSWSIGMTTFTYPHNAGLSIGEDISFVMEILYLNPHQPDLRDSSGLLIFYTSKLRPYDAGVLTTGSLVRESQIIPPKTSNFVVQGHCMKECLALALPPRGHVVIFAALMRARKLGRKIKIRHFREGHELSPIAEDNRFDSFHQGTVFLGGDIHLKNDDNLIVECTYDTYDREEITYVNNSKGGESCLGYLSYYPKIEKLTGCVTAPTENAIMETVGVARLGEVNKSLEKFEWTTQRSREYNSRLLNSQVYVHCGDTMLKDPQPVPSINSTYVRGDKCPPKDSGTDSRSRMSYSLFVAITLISCTYIL